MSGPAGGSSGGSPDEPHDYEVRRSQESFRGRVISVRTDEVAMPGGGTSQRDVVVHPGAVGIVALDDHDRVLMVRQYRHPIGGPVWELPAGLLDVDGEPALESAQRELYEEGGVRAREWAVLADARPSPGMTDEAIRVYLARGITAVDEADRHVGEHEEADLLLDWVDLDEAVRRVFAGELENATAILGVLAAARAREEGWGPLRPPTSPWPARPDRA